MTKEELDYVVGMAERYGRDLAETRRYADNIEKLASETRKEDEAEVRDVRGWCKELEDDGAKLRDKVVRLNEALAEKERTIIARDAAISAMTVQVSDARPAGLVWHRAENADGTPNLPGAEVQDIVTTSLAKIHIDKWSRLDDGRPGWVGKDGRFYNNAAWWAEVNMPSETDDGGAA